MANASPEDLARVREMMAALNDMLDADARGEHTPEQFAEFMQNYGDFFPDQPENLAELVDSLARRSAAAQRLMNSLSAQQRAELGQLMADMLGADGLAEQMARLQAGLRSARPDLPLGRPRADGRRPADGLLRRHRRAVGTGRSGRAAVAGRSGLPGRVAGRHRRRAGRARAGPPGRRRPGRSCARSSGSYSARATSNAPRAKACSSPRVPCGGSGPRRCGGCSPTWPRPVAAPTTCRTPGPSGEATGSTRTWEFGDEQPLDVTRTVRNAILRTAADPEARQGGSRVQLTAEDFEVAETERRSHAAVALLVDMSFSMELRGTWGEAKTTALALHSLITTKFPQDAIQIIGFSDYARPMTPGDLISHEWERVQGTNLQHALMLARRHLDRHRNAEPVILVITDGEPTAHLTSGRLRRLRLAADPRDDRGHGGRGGPLHPARGDHQRLHARQRAGPDRLHERGGPPQRRSPVRAQARPAGRVRRRRLPARAGRSPPRRLSHPSGHRPAPV